MQFGLAKEVFAASKSRTTVEQMVSMPFDQEQKRIGDHVLLLERSLEDNVLATGVEVGN